MIIIINSYEYNHKYIKYDIQFNDIYIYIYIYIYTHYICNQYID